MLPNTRLIARTFYRFPPSTTTLTRTFSSSHSSQKWEGRPAQANATREKDSHNVQHDAVKDGKKEKTKGHEEGVSRGASEKSGDANKKAKEEFPEAPDTVGMQDERGQKL